MAELVWAKKNFRLIVMIRTDNKVFWIWIWILPSCSWSRTAQETNCSQTLAVGRNKTTAGAESIPWPTSGSTGCLLIIGSVSAYRLCSSTVHAFIDIYFQHMPSAVDAFSLKYALLLGIGVKYLSVAWFAEKQVLTSMAGAATGIIFVATKEYLPGQNVCPDNYLSRQT